MNQQRIIFETSEGFILVCLLAGIGYAYLLYSKKHPWSKRINQFLFALRAVLAFFLAALLLGPIVRQVKNLIEKPIFVILQDDSQSVAEATDAQTLANMKNTLATVSASMVANGFQVEQTNLEGEVNDTIRYNASTSDLQSALRDITNRYEGQKLGGVLMVSDGIYNSGLSPLYTNYNFPVYTLGLGDTAQRIDVTIKNILYNKIAYQGNRFPIRVEVLANGITDQNLTVTLAHKGVEIDRQLKPIIEGQLLTFDFQPQADEQGFQKYDIQVEVKKSEVNTRNNRASVFIEVVEGKKKILLIASSPHPDIKAIRSAIEKNSNYEFSLLIPGVTEVTAEDIQFSKVDLVIFHQVPDVRGRTREIFQRVNSSKTSSLIILGRQIDLAFLGRAGVPLKVESISRDYDEVTPVLNSSFSNFLLAEEVNSNLIEYPPVSVPFGKMSTPLSATPLLFQRIGNVITDKPLLAVESVDDKKVAIMLGEGIWRWRLDEFERTEATAGFDELFGKLVQYLSTQDDKKKFRSYPIKQEFSESEPVVIESQVYNDIYEPVYGNTIDLELVNDAGDRFQYQYLLSPGNIRYQIGGLKEGVYRFRSRTEINGVQEQVNGQFAVVTKLAEIQNLTADHQLLKKLSQNTGGKFFVTSDSAMVNALSSLNVENQIRSEESYNSIINLKWIFWVLLSMVSVEWLLRKYHGGY